MQPTPFTGGIGRNQDAHLRVGTKERLNAAALIAVDTTVDRDNRVGITQHAGDLPMEIIQGIAVLGKDDQLALAAAGIAHGRVVLQEAGEFFPFAILPRSDHGSGLLFKS